MPIWARDDIAWFEIAGFRFRDEDAFSAGVRLDKPDEEVRLLAKKSSILARRNPENFSYFAAAMYWGDYAWGTGTAKKVKQK